jgi:hypothetical protein
MSYKYKNICTVQVKFSLEKTQCLHVKAAAVPVRGCEGP